MFNTPSHRNFYIFSVSLLIIYFSIEPVMLWIDNVIYVLCPFLEDLKLPVPQLFDSDIFGGGFIIKAPLRKTHTKYFSTLIF